MLDPSSASLWAIRDARRRLLSQRGEASDNFWGRPRSESLNRINGQPIPPKMVDCKITAAQLGVPVTICRYFSGASNCIAESIRPCSKAWIQILPVKSISLPAGIQWLRRLTLEHLCRKAIDRPRERSPCAIFQSEAKRA